MSANSKGGIRRALFALAMVTAPISAQAEERGQACELAPLIVGTANRILEVRPQNPRILGARYGADAVYFKLLYDNIQTEDGLALIDRTKLELRHPPRGLDDVAHAYAISELGVEDGLASIAATQLEAYSLLSFTGLRAIVLAGGGEKLFELERALSEDAYLGLEAQNYPHRDVQIAMAVLDQPDGFKHDFAQLAEENGELDIAGYVLASRSNLEDYGNFLRRHAGDENLIATERNATVSNFTLGASARTTTLLRELPEEVLQRAQPYYDAYRATYFAREFSAFIIVYSQTGNENVANVARAYLEALDQGALGPDYDTEAAWAFVFQGLIKEIGRAEAYQILDQFNGSHLPHYAGMALQNFSWATATFTLREYLHGGELPARPSALPPDFDWEVWVRMAAQIRSGAPIVGPTSIAAELLFTKGDYHEAIDVARGLDAREELRMLKDFMGRMGKRCERFAPIPGQQLLIGAQLVYRF